MKRGILLGRFEPLHKGHESIIDEIFAMGLRPLLLVGGSGRADDRHPYSDHQRHSMLRRIYGYSIDIVHIEDKEDWDDWFLDINQHILPSDAIFVNNKEQDRVAFTLNGKDYTNAFYTDIWEDNGYTVHKVTFPAKLGIDGINATDIRKDIEGNAHMLSSSVLSYLRSLRTK